MKPDVKGIRAPEFPAMEWLNCEPLTRTTLRGMTLLVEFWDYTCLESLANVPLLSQWHHLYRDHDLTILGVHTPEFPFAAQKPNLERAVSELGIRYPVALDAGHETWKAFHNRQWPARYLFDAGGILVYYHHGAGDDSGCEEAFRASLGSRESAAGLPPARTALERHRGRQFQSQRVHLGLDQGRIGNHPAGATGEVEDFTLPGRREEARAYLDGKWRNLPHCVESAANEPCEISFRYTGTDAYVTLESRERIDLEITLDDGPVPGPLRGDDVRVTDSGATWVSVLDPRNYQLISSRQSASRDIRLHGEATGLRAYALRLIGPLEREPGDGG